MHCNCAYVLSYIYNIQPVAGTNYNWEEQLGNQQVTSETTPHTIHPVNLVVRKGLAECGLRTGFGEGFLGTLAPLQLDVFGREDPSKFKELN